MASHVNPVIDAILSRRTVKKMDPERAPSSEQVETIIEAAIWAPNHHLTEPWRFVVITGEGRVRLGQALADAAVNSPGERPIPERVQLEKAKPMGAPIIVALISRPDLGERTVPQEEMIAAGAALQNMLLAAHSLGLGSFVRTGALAYSEEVRRLLEMETSEKLVGMVYLGYPSGPTPVGRRSPSAGKVTRIEG